MVEPSPRRLTILMNDHEDAFQSYGQSERSEMRARERKRRENIIKKSKKCLQDATVSCKNTCYSGIV
jgi:hypothetical protein